MSKIITAFANENTSNKIKFILSNNELNIVAHCSSYVQFINMYWQSSETIFVGNYRFNSGDILNANGINNNNYIICVTNEIEKSDIDNESVFILKIPLDIKLLINTIKMLENITNSRYLKNNEEYFHISYAKKILIEDLGFREDQAHRFIQKKSMDIGVKTYCVAKIIYDCFR